MCTMSAAVALRNLIKKDYPENAQTMALETIRLASRKNRKRHPFGLKAYDVTTLAFAFILLALIAILASWLPAFKASRLRPVAALRIDELRVDNGKRTTHTL